MRCLGAESLISAERTPRQREWRPQIYRKCTDTPWLFLFFLFWTGLVFITGYSVVAGAPGGLLFGHDSFGNVCGKKNPPVEGAPLSGQDMTLKKHVFFMNSCHLEVEAGRPGPTALCVSSCPDEQLDTLEEVQLFANKSGSFLCVYSLSSANYTQDPNADSLCPRLPVPPSKPFPLLNRCVPQTPECYSGFASVLLNDADPLHRILSGVMSGRDTVFGLCVLALALSLAVSLTFRFITGLLLHTLIALVILGLLSKRSLRESGHLAPARSPWEVPGQVGRRGASRSGPGVHPGKGRPTPAGSCLEDSLNEFVCGVLWWLYYDYTRDLSVALDTEWDNMACLLGFAVVSTAFTAVLLVLIFVLRKRVKLAVELLWVTNKAIDRCPFLLLQPLWTVTGLLFFWALWVAVLLSLGTAGAAQVTGGGQVEYTPLLGIRCMWGYHLVGLVWTSEFILACQQMTVAGAVVACYFTRNENDPPDRPVLSSLATLLCYHPGTAVKGSFLIPLVRIPRAVVLCLSSALQDQRSAWSRCVFRCCSGCLCCLDGCLCPLSQQAYTATAINGTDFCTSAKDVCRLLSQKSRHFTSVNCFGDFVIFLGKVLVACLSVFGGLMAFNYHRELQVWAAPLLLVAFFASLVAHSVLSVFGAVLDALLLCFAVDLETNDGSSEKPYFMDRELLSFVKRIDKLNGARSQRDRCSERNEEGTELRPIGR
ncbi:choline transporter-like protein 3 isoform X3 [Desmodus rotundus]|uniref:choline transporter-like protein 3 isoform X3 n=1 Tax=Desmodus rotundus TaxID=9430 RepID=UPI00238146A7|nr:choline transporter-like protein 3 isoform X3 [Desmodus rotundus]